MEKDRLIEVIADVLDMDSEELTGASGPGEPEEWDSVNSLRILTNIEEEFDVKIPFGVYCSTKTIDGLGELLRRFENGGAG